MSHPMWISDLPVIRVQPPTPVGSPLARVEDTDEPSFWGDIYAHARTQYASYAALACAFESPELATAPALPLHHTSSHVPPEPYTPNFEQRLASRVADDVEDAVDSAARALSHPSDAHVPFAGVAPNAGEWLRSVVDVFRAEVSGILAS